MLVSMWRKENPSTSGEYKLEQLLWKIVQKFFQKLKKKKERKEKPAILLLLYISRK